MATSYGWERLQEVGHFVLCEGKTAKQVSSAAKIYVEKHLSPEAQIAAVSTPVGALVFLAYVPKRAEDPPPQPAVVEPPAKTKRQQEQEAKAEERRQIAAEKEAEKRKLAAAGIRNILKNVKGHAAWNIDLSSEEKSRREERWAEAEAAGASDEELEDILTGADGHED